MVKPRWQGGFKTGRYFWDFIVAKLPCDLKLEEIDS